MKRILLAGLVLSAFALPAPAALAADYDHVGGCSFASTTDMVAGQGQQTGEIDIEAIVYSPNPGENPVSATITCYIMVNGSTQPGTTVSASGTVAVVGGGIISYTSASDADSVSLCERVEYSGRLGYAKVEVCKHVSVIVVPAPIVDEIACWVISQLWGSYYVLGVWVEVTWQGDVYINGDLYYDCPPYDTNKQWISIYKPLPPIFD